MAKHSVEKTRRQYNRWVATETLEDYALRYSPASFRKWSPLLLANTAIGSISFLALEAIGASLLLSYGYSNAVWAILFASVFIFGAGLPISYYAARYNIDIDLLTRSAGFGYVGSTITSLIYASFCFIFFALEASIMAQALELYFKLPLYLGYVLCSLIIIPIVFYGITAINRLHLWTQPIWLILMLLPLFFLYTQVPDTMEALSQFKGQLSGSNEFDPYFFGIATGISFSLIAQIGEQVDYLRFMPDKHQGNRSIWWMSMLAAGPGWIILGCFKQLVGVLLASVVVLAGLAYTEAKEPVHMYYIAYRYVFDHPGLALLFSTFFVITSQVKINVTNAYAGSLAWSNFFSRVTHAHPGRVVWLIFNIGIALLLMEMGIFQALQKVLGLYSNVAIAWISAVVADLTINKVLKLRPPIVEFKRAHLYDYNPVGFVSMLVASLTSIIAFTGAFGLYAQAYSWLIAMTMSFMLVPVIAKLTKGKYYIARHNVHFKNSDQLHTCGVCDQQYVQTDFAYCTFYDVPICSLCCTLDSNCKDSCKPKNVMPFQQFAIYVIDAIFKHRLSRLATLRVVRFCKLSGFGLGIVAIAFWSTYTLTNDLLAPEFLAALKVNLLILFFVLGIMICIFAWWVILGQESQVLAETELEEQNVQLSVEIAERKQIESKLKHSEQQFRALLESTPDPMVIVNSSGIINIANHQALDLFGYTKSELLGQSVDILFKDGLSYLRTKLSEHDIDDTQPASPNKQQDVFITTREGKEIPVEISLGLINTPEGLLIAAALRDITERRRVEYILAKSEMKFRTLYTSTSEAVMILDEQGFFDCNDAALAVFGCETREEFYTRQPSDFSPLKQPCGRDSLTYYKDMNSKALELGSYSFEWLFQRADNGKIFPADIVLSSMELDGKSVLLATVRDITDRKQYEEKIVQLAEAKDQLLQSDKMATVGQLAAGVAHELNNPIAFVYSNLGSLEGYITDILEITTAYQAFVHKNDLTNVIDIKIEENFEYLRGDIIDLIAESKDGLSRMKNIVADLKNFSRVGELEWQFVDLHNGLDSTLNIVWHELKYKCTVTKDYSDKIPEVRCIASQLNQVFMNLLVNAGHAIEENGTIKITTRLCPNDNTSIQILISDTGKGILPENLKRIFDPFFTTKPVGKGTGLGLSIVWGIIAKHHGTIDVSSTVNIGSTFTITLPIDQHDS